MPAHFAHHARRRPPARRCRRGWVWGWALACGLGAAAEGSDGAHWRWHRAEDGLAESLCTAITVSPRGHLWIKHGEVNAISGLDGYTVQRVPAPADRIFRVHQSRAGRLWALYEDGVLGYTGESWTRYPLTAHLTTPELNQLRAGRSPALVPAEEDRLLLVFPERLVLFRAVDGSFTVLREARTTPLGPFQDLTPAPGGGLWLVAAGGVARVAGPLRQIQPDTPWSFHLVPPELGATNLYRAFADDRGGVTALADLPALNRRGLVHFDGERWTVRSLPEENLRFAWRDPEPDTFWGVTLGRLVRFVGTNVVTVRPPAPLAQILDVAVQPRGIFWLASRNGVVRYAPAAWRRPAHPDSPRGGVSHLALDEAGRLWCATDSGLWWRSGERWQHQPWPEEFAPLVPEGVTLHPLAEGGVVAHAGRHLWRREPTAARFETITHPEGRQWVRVLGRPDPGTWLVLTRPPPAAPDPTPRVERFDGRAFAPWTEGPALPADRGEFFFLERAASGDWWLGATAGPAWWREDRWQFFGTADGYADDGAVAWLEFADGRLWCAGLRQVHEFDGRRWTLQLGNLDHVHTLRRTSDGSVWVGANNGLFRFYRGSWLGVGEPEGLPALAVTSLVEDRQRRLWAGTGGGLVEYFPRADYEPPRTLAVTWEQEASATGEGSGWLRLTGRDRWRFSPDERLVFAHRLDEGEWSGWSPDPMIRLRGLAQGRHRVEVRAMDRNWNEEIHPLAFTFRVLVPWYRDQRVVLAAAVGLGLALVAAGVAVNRHLRLRRSYEDVGRQVEERTRELRRATEALAQSQKMTALGTLAAGIAHDFNNLLSIIKGSAQLIAAQPEDREKVLTRVSRILTMVDQASEVVKALLGFGTTTDRTPQPCDLNELVARTVRLLSDRFRRDIEVRLVLSPDLPPVLAAADPVQQILLNLIFNGADAMNGRGVIEVTTTRVDRLPRDLALAPRPATTYVQVSVRDTGCGIPPEVLPRIFEPFFTTKAQSGRPGRGLGLYMVYQFAREMGHGLHVETAPGRGSTFSLLLPVAEKSAADSPALEVRRPL